MDYKEQRLRDSVLRDIAKYKATGVLPTERMRVSARPRTVSLSVLHDLVDSLPTISSSIYTTKYILGLTYTSIQKEVLYKLIDGKSQAQIARELGVSRQRVDRVVDRLRTIVSESFKQDAFGEFESA